VTDRCNLRCVYCMPEEGVPFTGRANLLTTAEFLRVIRIAAELGVNKVRFTGGEPLVHQDIVRLVRETVAIPGIQSTHLTTNGVLLEKHAVPLRDAGLTGINVSMDTLDPERFRRITRREGIEHVLAGIRAAVTLGFPSVKVNVVAMRGFNDDELARFVDLTRELPVTVRFIELMPFDAHQIWKTGRFLSSERLAAEFLKAFPEAEQSSGSTTEHRVFRLPGAGGKVAFIPSYSRDLCGDCNRIRLTADGSIRNCLYSTEEYDLRAALRGGADDDRIAEILRRAVREKLVDGWAAQRQAKNREARPGDHERSSMTQIGG
jgi:cyclic pyranopterin phosphate synthase